jgi:dCTP deaminase
MSLLSDAAIKAALKSGAIGITPPPNPEDFDTDSIDVHLGESIYFWRTPAGGADYTIPLWKAKVDPGHFDYIQFANENLTPVQPDRFGIFTMRPQTYYLADVLEKTKLPLDVAMHIQGKSTLARLGVMVHLTAPHAHAGWSGVLTLEMYNLGPFHIQLKAGMPIGQLTFWRLESPGTAETREGKTFSDQITASGRK